MKIPEDTSKVITLLRFPMIIGIVLIHSSSTGNLVPAAEIFQYLISNDIARACVPLYFCISGYLMFYGLQSFSTRIYRNKVKSRIKSILIPYLIWNLISFIQFNIKPVITGSMKANDYLVKFIDCFWGTYTTAHPLYEPSLLPGNFPLWFLRDLFIYVLLMPLFYYLLKKYGRYVIALLSIAFVGGFWYHIPCFSITGVLFYSAGAYLGIRRFDPSAFRTACPKLSNTIIIIWIAAILSDCMLSETRASYYAHTFQILTGTMAIFCIAWIVSKKQSVKIPGRLTAAAFCIYLMHGILRPYVLHLYNVLPSDFVGETTAYICVSAILIFIPLIFYICLRHLFPRTLSIMLGGRLD